MGEEILLVTDEDRVALALARSLGRAGYRVALATSEPRPLAAASRFVERLVSLPDPLAGPPGDFAAAAIRAARAAPPALLVPAGDLAFAALAPARAELERVTPVLLPAAPLVAACFDRHELLTRAHAAGLCVPAHDVFNSYADAQLLAERLVFPVVVRPAARVQWGRGGRGARRLGLVAGDRSNFLRAADEMLALGPALAEEPPAGERVGLTLLFDRGAAIAACQHRVRHELDGRRGTASYRETVAVDPTLMASARTLFAQFAPSGLMTITFRVEGKRSVFFDASLGPDEALALAAAAGVDLAVAAVELALGANRQVSGADAARPVPAVPDGGRLGLRVRHLARDVEWQRARGVSHLAGAVPGVIAAAGRLLAGGERLEVESAADLGPTGGEVRMLGARVLAALRRARARAGAHLAHLLAGAPRRTSARHILVLCDGNICRSPFIEHRLRARLGARTGAATAGAAITVESAGLRAALGHPAPPLAREAAARLGVDLSTHRSRPAAAELVAAADLILVMDLDQQSRFIAAHPQAADRVALMARFDPARLAPPEIPDPVFGDALTFDRVYARLLRATDRLAAALAATGD